MRLPIGWLKDFIETPGSSDQIVSSLLGHSCEVEEVYDPAKQVTKVVVGKILSIEKHPNADKLVVCQLDVGSTSRQIVTGANNMTVGDLVPVALDGATLPSGLSIKASSLRGVNSEGMLCSQKELGLSEGAEGIMILPPDASPGQNIMDSLGMEAVLTLAVLPNRGDLQSVLGIARELAATSGQPLKEAEIYQPKTSLTVKELPLSIRIDAADLCKRYMGVAIRGVRLAASPVWMQKRLTAAGLNPVNNVVDITNYVMLELGQPLHAFNYDGIKDACIVIRRAREEEAFTLLNEQSISLTSSHLIISDSEQPIALAGIMGGAHSAITPTTKDIVLESAFFNPVNIRKTSFSLALRSESSQRFEKGVDYLAVETAFRRAIHLILELTGGQIASEMIDLQPEGGPSPVSIPFRAERVNALLGASISAAQMIKILSSLGFRVKSESPEALIAEVPSFRQSDVSRQADLVEEIGRMFGYDLMESSLPPIFDFSGNCQPKTYFDLNNQLRELLTGHGASEIVSYSMISPEEHPFIFDHPLVEIQNPISHTESVLRPNLFASLLKNYEYNAHHLVSELKHFEIGSVFYKEGEQIREELRCGLLIAGRRENASFEKANHPAEFCDIKGILESCLSALVNKKLLFADNHLFSFLHPFRSCEARIGKETLAVFGEIHPGLAKHYGFKKTVHYMELFIPTLATYLNTRKRFEPFSLFPQVQRDISFWIDRTVSCETILKAVNAAKAEHLFATHLIDVYDGKKYGDDKINIVLSVVFQSEKGTLTDEVVREQLQTITRVIESKFSIIFA